MFDYTKAFLTPFSWARRAYEHTLRVAATKEVQVLPEDLTGPALPSVGTARREINDDESWNAESEEHLGNLASIYASADQADRYIHSIRTLLEGRISETERRNQELDSNLRSLRGQIQGNATTSITIRGGEDTALERSSRYYRDVPPLRAVPQEGCYRLDDNGFHSTIRSMGGFAGQVRIEQSLGEITEIGSLDAIVDGSVDTFWMGSVFSPAPMRGARESIHWLPEAYRHGSAFMLTYYLDRPSYASEVFLHPIATEPFDLVAVSWTPYGVKNAIPADIARFEQSAGGWVFVGTAGYALTQGLSGGNGVVVGEGGAVQRSFNIVSALTITLSGIEQVPASGDAEGARVEFIYQMKGKGDCRAGARIVWYDAGGNAIDYDFKSDYPTAFFASHRLVSYVPPLAVNGRVEVLMFSATTQASAYFDNAELYVGEQKWFPYAQIDRPTTIPLPGTVLSGRYSFVLSQRSPRMETLARESASVLPGQLPAAAEIDQALRKTAEAAFEQLGDQGSGRSTFVYRVGLKELDLRNRQHIPRGALVSIPIRARREIRSVWLVSETVGAGDEGSSYYVYPYPDDENFKVDLRPFKIGLLDDSGQSLRAGGDILEILTPEEVEAGWGIGVPLSVTIEPKPVVDVFDGTDRDGRLKLRQVPHLRRPSVRRLSEWLRKYAVWPTSFDPNAKTAVGILDEGVRSAVRENDTSRTLKLIELATAPGYIPVKVTVSNERFTAHPDTLGRPDLTRVRSVDGETLVQITESNQRVETRSDAVTFQQYLAGTTLRELLAADTKVPISPSLIRIASNRTLKEIIEGLGIPTDRSTDALKQRAKSIRESTGILKDLKMANISPTNAGTLLSVAKRVYERLKASDRLPMLGTAVTTLTSQVDRNDVFKTRFAPVVSGPSGSFMRLYWRNSGTGEVRPVPQSAYEVVAQYGTVRMLTSAPSGFSEVLADYKYLSNSASEDFFSQPLSFVGGDNGSNPYLREFSRTLPVTRNMTDYLTGKTPDLREPNFDRLSDDYWPVIEYYVTPDGELVFARDFFKYGDMPSSVKVEYETLGVGPRMSVEVNRATAPNASPSLRSITMRVKEGAAVPTREKL